MEVPKGTLKLAMNLPVEAVVTVATKVPSKVIVTTESGVNPEPVTSTEVRTGPEVGFIEMVGLDATYLMLKSSMHNYYQPHLS